MNGKLIVLEGIDGSGKSTQFSRLRDRLDAENIQFHHIIFPRYDNPSSALLRMYLGGEFGQNPSDVNEYAASTFYAVDRYASFHTDWREEYQSGRLILSDRYSTANAVHQGAKAPADGLDAFLDWLYDFEHRKLGLPAPDVVIYLDVDLETALARMRERQARTETQGDIHENDVRYLEKCINAGGHAAARYGWRRVDCGGRDRLRGIDEIHEEIYAIVKECLQ